ncbi:MAG: Na+/H+ antiporter subunit E [Actinomycetia bacterium]|nr:Na+/H+ antiporter subunit E [Actinomycetes bacterium]MCH9702537.1 Na+/H+ antiporter subunit E [Actinomycetes bacterium]MCH9760081.1 Na+/H+ antiporter subunit E [Actinomycetes bacterium]
MSARLKIRRQRKRTALRVWILCWLILVWVLLWGSVSAANILSGLAIALIITLFLPLPPVPVQGRFHPLPLLRLILNVAYSLVVSSVQVAALALRPEPPMSAVVRAQLALKSDLVLALAVNILNLTPGTIVLEIDQARRMIYVHVLDVRSDPEVQRFRQRLDRLQKLLISSFERDADWTPTAQRGTGG